MRKSSRHIVSLFVVLILIVIPASAQFRSDSRSGDFGSRVRPTFLLSSPSPSLLEGQDTIVHSRSSRSPALATIFSAIAPGSGQIYVERYWTLPLIWGFGYWFVRQYIVADRKYDEWRAKYSDMLAGGSPPDDRYVQYTKYVRDFYRDQRDSFAFYLAITYVLNIVDAYVGASLYNFDVSEDLGGNSNIRLQLRLPLQ